MRAIACCLVLWAAAPAVAHADDPPPVPPTNDQLADPGKAVTPDAPTTAGSADPPTPAADPAAPADGERGELIEITGSAPTPPGAITLDARVARQTAGALGEPFRALALLPGVTTSIAASGYPIIRGTLPGESRFTYDGIEIPMLYHLLLGNQVIHPSFIGDMQLRAGGHGAEQGNLIGGLVALTPSASDEVRTELRANPVEIGAYRAQPLSSTTSIAVAARTGTLGIEAKIYDSRTALYYVDQQTRLVHRLGNGDLVTLTSLGAYDYARLPPDFDSTTTEKLGFHRLDVRWTRVRADHQLRAGIETALDVFSEIIVPHPFTDPDGMVQQEPTDRSGGHSYGVRAYADGGLQLTPWLTGRAGLEARHRTLVNGAFPFVLTRSNDPYLGLAKAVDAEGAWAALDLRIGPLLVTPGLRVDSYHAELYGAAVRYVTVDPRLTIASELPGGVRAQLAVGEYSAPPSVSVVSASTVIGPLPMTDGTGSAAGMNHGAQAELSVSAPLPAGLQGNFAAYYRDTHYSIDFGMSDKRFVSGGPCDVHGSTQVYRDIDTRAIGFEAMIRRELGRSVTGWVSYSLGKSDRDFGFIQLPSDYDQRHTLNATAQWKRGRWLLGASGHLHTGRPALYPQYTTCAPSSVGSPSYIGSLETADKLRRLPTDVRLDLRAERAFQLDGWQMRVYLEMQNATLAPEPLRYELQYNPSGAGAHVVTSSLLIPLPLIGIEVVL